MCFLKTTIDEGVPWCNAEHSGLWIQWSEFKSPWDLSASLDETQDRAGTAGGGAGDWQGPGQVRLEV